MATTAESSKAAPGIDDVPFMPNGEEDGAGRLTLGELVRRVTRDRPVAQGSRSGVWRFVPGAVIEQRPARPDEAACALKLARLDDPYRRRYLPREFGYLSRLDSPYVPRPVGHGMAGDQTYVLVTRWVDGRNLMLHGREIVTDMLDEARFNRFVDHILAIGDTLAAAGICHSDIWEPNIIMSGERPVLIDFGWARDTGMPPPRDNLHQPDDTRAIRQLLLRVGMLRRMVGAERR